MLAFKPNLFFNELERISGYSRKTLHDTYYKAKKSGLVSHGTSAVPQLTLSGRQYVEPFVAQHLPRGARLMVIFDVPEAEAARRRQFRTVLRQLDFEQIQQSVWMSAYDHRQLIEDVAQELDLQDCVQTYEALRLFPA